MKYILTIIAAAIFTAAGTGPADAQAGNKKNTETVVYSVSLSCANCKARLEKHIPFEKGVKDMEVDLEEKLVTVTFDPRKNTAEGIAAAIEKLGYTCRVVEQP